MDSLLLTVMMLCYLEIAAGSRHKWATHLHGAISLVDFCHGRNPESTKSPFAIETMQFVSDFLSLRDTFSATTLNDSSLSLGTWTSHIHSLYLSLGDDNKAARTHINAHKGLSAELLDIISSITELARCKYRMRHEGRSGYQIDSRVLEDANALRQRLEQLQQWSEEQYLNHVIYTNASGFEEQLGYTSYTPHMTI